MKGLFLKEFYIWLRSRSYYLMLALVYGILLAFADGSRTGITLYFTFITLPRAFADDETSNWRDYAHALPYTPSQIVSAKYFILLAETVISLITITVLSAISLNSLHRYNFWDAFPYLSNGWQLASNMTVIAVCALVGFAFMMPLNYRFTGNLRFFLSAIPTLLAILPIFIISLRLILSDIIPYMAIPHTFYNNKWLFAAFAAIALLSLAASFMLCVIFTAKNKSRTKSLKIAFAVVTAALVVISAVTVGIICSKKLFVEDEQLRDELLWEYYHDDENTPLSEPAKKEYVLSEENIKNREEIMFLAENLLAEYHEGHHLEDCRKEVDELGLYEKTNAFDEYCLREGGAYVRLYSETDTDRIFQINISASVGDTYIEEASQKELDEIGSRFKTGMTEDELWKLYEELELYPYYIEEKHDAEFGTMRCYNAKFHVADYNGTGEYAFYQVFVDVADGEISEVRLYTKE